MSKIETTPNDLVAGSDNATPFDDGFGDLMQRVSKLVSGKSVTLPLAEVVGDNVAAFVARIIGDNVRDKSAGAYAKAYRIGEMVEQLKADGVQESPVLLAKYLVGTTVTYDVLRGNRRVLAILQLSATDPKNWSQLKAHVLDMGRKLTEMEAMKLRWDTSSAAPLTVGALLQGFRGIMEVAELRNVNVREITICTLLRAAMDNYSPIKKDAPKNLEEYWKTRKGLIGQLKQWWSLPEPVRTKAQEKWSTGVVGITGTIKAMYDSLRNQDVKGYDALVDGLNGVALGEKNLPKAGKMIQSPQASNVASLSRSAIVTAVIARVQQTITPASFDAFAALLANWEKANPELVTEWCKVLTPTVPAKSPTAESSTPAEPNK